MSVTKASSVDLEVKFLKTSMPALNAAVGGGIPLGKITEIHGPSSTGKSALALTITANAQKAGHTVYFVDGEYSLSDTLIERYGVDSKKLMLIRNTFGEEYMTELEAILTKEKDIVVVIDSITSLIPRRIKESAAGEHNIGAQSKMVSDFLMRTVPLYPTRNNTLIVVNQERPDFGNANGYTLTCGRSLAYYKDVEIRLKFAFPKSVVKQGDKVIGRRIKGRIEKNKVGAPLKEFESNLMFDVGFDAQADMIDVALELGILHKKGNTIWYGEDVKLGVGANKAREFLVAHPEISEKIKNDL